MKNPIRKTNYQYIPSFLTNSNRPLECWIAGLKHTLMRQIDLENEGFYSKVGYEVDKIHKLGRVTVQGEFGYLKCGAFMYKFLMAELRLMST